MLSRWTVRWLQKISPDKRLEWAASLFWWTVVLSILSVIFLCHTWFERTLMLISWWAITITCVDLVSTNDVRVREEDMKK